MTTLRKRAEDYAKYIMSVVSYGLTMEAITDLLADAYEQGWVDRIQWHDAEREKPQIGEEVVWHVRTRSPKGTWLDGYISDRYDGDYEPENAEHWMHIPEPKNEQKGGAGQWLSKD